MKLKIETEMDPRDMKQFDLSLQSKDSMVKVNRG